MSLGQILFFHHMKLHKSNNWHCAPKTCSQSLVFILPNFEKRLGEKWLSFDFFVIRKEWIRVELDFRSHRSWMVKVFLSHLFFFLWYFSLCHGWHLVDYLSPNRFKHVINVVHLGVPSYPFYFQDHLLLKTLESSFMGSIPIHGFAQGTPLGNSFELCQLASFPYFFKEVQVQKWQNSNPKSSICIVCLDTLNISIFVTLTWLKQFSLRVNGPNFVNCPLFHFYIHRLANESNDSMVLLKSSSQWDFVEYRDV